MRSEWLFHSASSLARRLPLPAAYAIADLTAALAPVLSRRRAGAARANIESLAPWLEPPRAPRALLGSAFRSHHRLVLEFLRASALPLERVKEAVEFCGLDNLRKALEPGRGVILVTTHVGNWEVAAIALDRAGVPVHSVAGVQFHPLVSLAARLVKERAGLMLHGPEAAPLLGALRAGHAVVLHLDGGFIGRGAKVTLFGRPAWIARGPAVLAARSGASLLPLTTRRVGPFRFEVAIGEPLVPAGSPPCAELLAREIERQVTAAPEQWALFRELGAPPHRTRREAPRGLPRDPARERRAPRGTSRGPGAPRGEPDGRALRIALVTQSYYPAFGGLSEHVHHLASALTVRGHAVTIVTAGFGETARSGSNGNGTARSAHEEPPRVVRLGRGVSVPFHGGRSHLVLGWRLGPRLDRVLADGGFDIVHTHSPLVPTLPLLALRAQGARVVGTFHTAGSSARYEIAAPALRRMLRPLEAGVAVSEPARAFAERFYEGPITVIPNGIDLERFHPNGSTPRSKPQVILCVGRFESRKGHVALLDAFARLHARRPGRVVLVLVGDGPLGGALRERAARIGPDAVRFVGTVPPEKLPGYYRAADLFVAPALRNESFGIVLLEAMASGLAVVASDIPGYRSVAGASARLVRAGDARELCSALDDLLEDPAGREALARSGRERAAGYRWSDIAARLEELYRGVLSRRAG